MSELLTTIELAEYLKLRPETVIRKAKKGEIPAIRIGRQFRFDKNQIDNWLLRRVTGKELHILVVDDEQVINELFEYVLRKVGIKVTTALSSIEALGIIQRRQFDMAFIDLKMPMIDGNELIKQLRQIDDTLPIVIITGHPDSKLLESALKYSPFMVLKKPFGPSEILSVIRSILPSIST
jgi:excisionase family DNA binding protein